MKWILTLAAILMLVTSCSAPAPTPSEAPAPIAVPQANLPNPAAVYCEQQGFKSEIRTAADGSQSGVCIFPDGSECDEWTFFRGQCGPSGTAPTSAPASIPTALPIDPANYGQGWWTYTHSAYGFSIMLPEDWVVEEITTFDPAMSGHTLTLHPEKASSESIRMAFRRAGEDARLWPTGVGQGEFVEQGTLDVAGQPAQRVLLVCPSGEVTAIWYHGVGADQPNIARGDMEFGFIYSTGTHCEAGKSLGGKVQLWGEMIIASLKVL